MCIFSIYYTRSDVKCSNKQLFANGFSSIRKKSKVLFSLQVTKKRVQFQCNKHLNITHTKNALFVDEKAVKKYEIEREKKNCE